MIVGVPTEVKDDEYRVALTPAGVRELTSAGHTVLVEKGAGDGSSMPDEDFVRTGAKIVEDADEVWAAADLICKVKEPVAEEYHRLGAASRTRPSSPTCTSPRRASAPTRCWLPATSPSPTRRCARPTTPSRCWPHERGGRADGPADGRPPPHATRRRPRACSSAGVPGVRCARVVILGAGVAGFAAATMAVGHALRRLHPRPQPRPAARGRPPLPGRARDRRLVPARHRGGLPRGRHRHRGGPGGRAPGLRTWCPTRWSADAPRIGAGRHLGRPGRLLRVHPADDALESDLRGVTGRIFYCVANMPGAVPHTSTHALANATLPYTLSIANLGWQRCGAARPCRCPRASTSSAARSSTRRWPRPMGCPHRPCGSWPRPDPYFETSSQFKALAYLTAQTDRATFSATSGALFHRVGLSRGPYTDPAVYGPRPYGPSRIRTQPYGPRRYRRGMGRIQEVRLKPLAHLPTSPSWPP